MINIKLFRGEKTESNKVYFKINDGQEKLLIFEELKKFAEQILYELKENKNIEYSITSDDNTILYKEVIENLIEGIKSDTELQKLYNENAK